MSVVLSSFLLRAQLIDGRHIDIVHRIMIDMHTPPPIVYELDDLETNLRRFEVLDWTSKSEDPTK